MNFLNNIVEKKIIICPQIVKEKILKEVNNYDRLINIKIYTLDEFKKNVYFNYDISTILYVMDKYKYSYEVSKYYIDNIYYIEDKKYDNEKLDFLLYLKEDLLNQNLLYFNSFFVESNKNTQILVFGYDYIDKFNEKMLSLFDYRIIQKKQFIDRMNKVYCFNTMEDEILFVANEIIRLLNEKIDINKIYLVNLDSNYNIEILRIFEMFNIPVDINISSSILTTKVGNDIFNYFSSCKSFEKTLEYIKTIKTNSDDIENIYDIFLQLFNKYIGCDYSFDSIIASIKYDLKNIKINNNNLENKVRVESLENNYFSDDSYVFLLGFNQGSVPKIIKDEDYINDELKKILNLSLTSEINVMKRKAALNNINSINNIIISFKKSYLDQEFYKSNLLDEKCFEICEIKNLDTFSSKKYSIIKLGEMLDNFIKYDKYDSNLSLYYNSFDIKYLKYDNEYKRINKDLLYSYLNNKIILSYSSVDTFFKCQFRYYIDNILKLNKFEENFEIIIGKLFHEILSKVYNENFDLDMEYSNYLKDKEFNDKEKFYLDKLKKELIIICDNLKEFYNDTEFKEIMVEKEISVDKSTNIKVIFKGIVDKIMYKEYPDKTLLSIIDYKTGNPSLDLFDSAYGLGMQLIIYLYLISKSNLFENYYCVGFYLQKILSNEVLIDTKKSYLEQKNDNLKLIGYSTDDRNLLELFDSTYENSKYIKSMKTTKEGFSFYAKVLSNEVMECICNLVDKKIDEARDKILDAQFNINPKWFDKDKDSIGCQFCKYKDLCFVKKENYVILKKYKDLEFLKGGKTNGLDK